MAYFLPFRPWLSLDLRVFSIKAAQRIRILLVERILSCTSTLPQRLSLLSAALLQASHADHGPLSKNTSL